MTVNLETDYVSALGWIVHTADAIFRSHCATTQLAFEDFIRSRDPRSLGLVVRFVPVGLPESDDTTVYGSTEILLRTMEPESDEPPFRPPESP